MKARRIWALLLIACIALSCGCAPGGRDASLPDLALVSVPETPAPQEPAEPYAGEKAADDLYLLDYLTDDFIWDAALWKDTVAGLYLYYDRDLDLSTGRVIFYDPATGEQLAVHDLPGHPSSANFVHYEDGTLGVFERGELYLFRDPLEAPLYKHEDPVDDVPFCLTPGGILRIRDHELLYEPDGGEERKLCDVERYADFRCADDDTAVLQLYADFENDVDPSALVVSLATGEAEEYPFDATDLKDADGALWLHSNFMARVRELDSRREFLLERGLDGEYLLRIGGGLAVTSHTQWEDEAHSCVLRVYDATDGTLLYRSGESWPLAGSWMGSADADGEKGLVLLSTETSADEGILREHYLLTSDGFAPLEAVKDPALDIPAYVRGIEETYGVRVLTGETAVSDYTQKDYEVEPVVEDDMTSLALRELAEALSQYPEGFFRELTDPVNEYCFSELHFLLVRKIRAASFAGPTSVAGFTQRDPDRPVAYIALDVRTSGSVESNAAHEIFHASEDRIVTLVDGNFNGFERWMDLNPEGVQYAYTFLNEDGEDFMSTEYTAAADAETACFIDSYARTYPNEDRARIFEYLYTNGRDDSILAGERRYPFLSDVLYTKAEYLCQVMRSAFKTVDAVDCARWEGMFRGKKP